MILLKLEINAVTFWKRGSPVPVVYIIYLWPKEAGETVSFASDGSKTESRAGPSCRSDQNKLNRAFHMEREMENKAGFYDRLFSPTYKRSLKDVQRFGILDVVE